ncbi:YihY/virulence factor BrkB family protein [Maridesulfovibrio ferrireducens]|uniref:YihY/virulence factor BrkB family protein n=1 Tax=Maridesulfovibrio ferrireducens TaxID=246191 RepID=UPI001A27A717|nr:YihY/virulence factor BrkB family protein [Maridesulfovibrio ferrireducens]MBI9110544.1 YihY/virulence factor BrkB family protein [Maridesulfovibrio ferrireducens]
MTTGKIGDKVSDFFLNEIWNWDSQKAGFVRRIFYTFSRVLYLVFYGFWKDQCMIRASALTFTTMLSIVPFIAVAFSILKGIGFQDSSYIHEILLKISAGREEVVTKMLEYVDNTNVKTLGVIGIATLLFTVLSTVGTIEKAFNVIWKVKKGRTFWRKFTDFFSVIFICPIAVIAATSVSVSIRKQAVLSSFENIYGVSEVESFFIKLAPLVLIWVAFTFIYAFMPNTRVRLFSAAVGGVVAGTVWQMAQWAYINWQVGVSKYNAIYGSFAQLPLFLLWLYLSWIIVLLGSEISYAVQNVMLYRQQRFMPDASMEDLQKISLLALSLMSVRFNNAESAYYVEDLATEMGVPVSFLSSMLDKFVVGGILVKASDEDTEKDIYTFAVSPEKISLLRIISILTGHGDEVTQKVSSSCMVYISNVIDDMRQALVDSGKDISLALCADQMIQNTLCSEKVDELVEPSTE